MEKMDAIKRERAGRFARLRVKSAERQAFPANEREKSQTGKLDKLDGILRRLLANEGPRE